MTALDPEAWRKIGPYLDQALDLDEAARAAWLADIRLRDSTLADQILILLREHESLGRDGFMEDGPRLISGRPARAGDRVGAYRLLEPVGHGGIGTVWLSERNDGRFDCRVAIKYPSMKPSTS